MIRIPQEMTVHGMQQHMGRLLVCLVVAAGCIQGVLCFSVIPGFDEKASASELMRQTLVTDPSLLVSVNNTVNNAFEYVTVTCNAAAGCTRAKAVALRSLLEPYNKAALLAAGNPRPNAPGLMDFDNMGVELQVYFGSELIRPQPLPRAADSAATLQLVKTAFTGNRLFIKADDLKPPQVSMACEPKPGPYSVFAPGVVQYRCPGMGSVCLVRAGTSNCNLIAAEAFEKVYKLTALGVVPTTAIKEAPGAVMTAGGVTPVGSHASSGSTGKLVAVVTTAARAGAPAPGSADAAATPKPGSKRFAVPISSSLAGRRRQQL